MLITEIVVGGHYECNVAGYVRGVTVIGIVYEESKPRCRLIDTDTKKELRKLRRASELVPRCLCAHCTGMKESSKKKDKDNA
jgi:hypothetical protein